MINSVVVVGRVVEQPKKLKTETGVIFSNLVLAVQRPFKNMDGDYDVDYINCLIWEALVDSCCEYCTKGSIIGVKGRLQTKINEVNFGTEAKNIKGMDVIAEKVTFIRIIRENNTIKEEKE